MIKQPDKFGESSYHGVILLATPGDLIRLCQCRDIEYQNNNGLGDKTNFDFEFETQTGVFFTVYDWKEYRSLDFEENIHFHIGAKDKKDSLIGRDALCTDLNHLKNKINDVLE